MRKSNRQARIVNKESPKRCTKLKKKKKKNMKKKIEEEMAFFHPLFIRRIFKLVSLFSTRMFHCAHFDLEYLAECVKCTLSCNASLSFSGFSSQFSRCDVAYSSHFLSLLLYSSHCCSVVFISSLEATGAIAVAVAVDVVVSWFYSFKSEAFFSSFVVSCLFSYGLFIHLTAFCIHAQAEQCVWIHIRMRCKVTSVVWNERIYRNKRRKWTCTGTHTQKHPNTQPTIQ